ncbi:MAG: tRNA (N(6)-L-threonylcarbamoyladenosine(37)-C(2))-methylthiotransferase MtaB [Thermodesulfovibrio sp.]|nr:tRNA (N(6)-L-threonylcarbamoyladenosine(37)-C(2))-methylthiotransferase MtaB [Thermodesulfovibrio sp.]
MKVCFITYGCKVNQAESQKWDKILRKRGYEVVNEPENADCWIVNTCAVTHKAEIQSRQIINKAKKLRKNAFITGCYVELIRPKSEENINFFVNNEKDNIINYFSYMHKEKDLISFSRHRAIIKIQDGCNQYCSYCIVPYLRGSPKSYEIREILREIQDYESIGIKEIILSGINIGLYGIDFRNHINLNTLLRSILKETKIPRVRLTSIEINYINEEFLEMLSHERICKHLHIPLQHGSDKILKLMNRPYSSKEFIEKIEKILSSYPEISIGTDVIVGFPKETEEDFNKTLKLIEDIDFSYIHVFTYSKRPLTLASQFPDQISEEIKKQRTNILLEIAKSKKLNYIKKFINKELEVIVETQKNSYFTGTSNNYIKCLIKTDNLIKGSLIKFIVEDIDGEHALGRAIKE